MKSSVGYCVSIYPMWSGSLHQILYTIGSRSPHTKRIGRNWMAPLSSLCLIPLRAEDNKKNNMSENGKNRCEKCGWDFNKNPQECPNCNAPMVTIQGVCIHCGRIEDIQSHPVEYPIPHEGKMLKCENCGSVEFKNVTIVVERR